MPMYSSRTPAWHGNSGERHSPLPFNETGENRRRVRPRHGSLRGFTPGRAHFTPTPANNAPQSQVSPTNYSHDAYILNSDFWGLLNRLGHD